MSFVFLCGKAIFLTCTNLGFYLAASLAFLCSSDIEMRSLRYVFGEKLRDKVLLPEISHWYQRKLLSLKERVEVKVVGVAS